MSARRRAGIAGAAALVTIAVAELWPAEAPGPAEDCGPALSDAEGQVQELAYALRVARSKNRLPKVGVARHPWDGARGDAPLLESLLARLRGAENLGVDCAADPCVAFVGFVSTVRSDEAAFDEVFTEFQRGADELNRLLDEAGHPAQGRDQHLLHDETGMAFVVQFPLPTAGAAMLDP